MKDKVLVEKDKEEFTKRIGEVLNRFQEIEFAYLFGSFLERDAFNDVDVALHVSKDFSPYKGVKFSLKVERAIEKEIEPRCVFDVKILNHAPIVFQYEVINVGEVTFSRDEKKRMRYEATVLSSYLDYKETSDWLDREFLAKV
jgi:predicted nucleotidyltransferase